MTTENNSLVLSGIAKRVFAADLVPGDFLIFDDAPVTEVIPTLNHRVTIKTTRRSTLTVRGDFTLLVKNPNLVVR